MRSKQKKFKFSKGEINERLLERQDLDILESSGSYIKNFISTPYGGAKVRNGTMNIDQIAVNLAEITKPSITSYAGVSGDVGVALPSEVTSYWKLDETTGDALDSVGSYDGVEQGTVPASTGVLDGSRGAYTTSNYFLYDTLGAANTAFDKQEFAIEFWFKVTADTVTQIALSKWDYNGIKGWFGGVLSDEKPTLRIASDDFQSATAISDSDWHYYYGARLSDGSNETRLYIDGVKVAEGTRAAWTEDSATKLAIGANNDSGSVAYPWLDNLCEMAYWDLTSTTKSWTDIESIITDRYNAGVGMKYRVS